MKNIVYYKENLKVKHNGILNQMPSGVTEGLDIARCEYIPPLNIGEYYEVYNVQEHTETYTVKEPREVKKVDEFGEEYIDTEYVEVQKQRPYKTCELSVVDKPNKAELVEYAKAKDYENKIVSLIRKRYSINAELAILRQRDTKPEEYAEYNAYVEECKAIAKGSV